jgi:hypothetical protein
LKCYERIDGHFGMKVFLSHSEEKAALGDTCSMPELRPTQNRQSESAVLRTSALHANMPFNVSVQSISVLIY